MNQLPVSPGTDPSRERDTRVRRHGLIEDWRDALGILLLLFVAAFLGAVLSRFWPETDVQGDPEYATLDMRLSALEGKLANLAQSRDMTATRGKLDTLERRLGAIETSFAELGAAPTTGVTAGTGPSAASQSLLGTAKRVEAIATRLDGLEARTGALPDEMAAARKSLDTLASGATGLQSSVDDIATRIARLESSDILDLARRASLASAIANLTRASQVSAPFRTEYDIVAQLLPEDADLKAIARHAASGLPTTGTLISTFANAAAAALDAERAGKGTDTVSRLWGNVSGLVTWRSTADKAGSSTESRLARAEMKLKAGDLPAAVAELAAIRGPAAKPLAAWLQTAGARVKVEATLARLNARAIEAITARPAAATPAPTPPAPEREAKRP